MSFLDSIARGLLSESKSLMDELTAYAKKSYSNARAMSDDPRERAELTAMTVGRQAKRMGLPLADVEKWLPNAYNQVWVIGGSLNPGMDLKEIRAIIRKAMSK